MFKKLFTDEHKYDNVYKPDKLGNIILPNGATFKRIKNDPLLGIDQIVELNGNYYGRRKVGKFLHKKWVRDPFPIDIAEKEDENEIDWYSIDQESDLNL